LASMAQSRLFHTGTDVMLAFALHIVCNVMNEVVPGSTVIVMTSFGTPPTINTGDPVPIPAPVLFTETAYPGPPLGLFVEQ
jgi:hypothetical protein